MSSLIKAGNFPSTLTPAPVPVFQLSGLRCWYDANLSVFEDSSATVPAQQCSPVSVWKDQSGNNHHLIQNVSTSQPIYRKYYRFDKSFIGFDGIDDSMQSSVSFQQTLSGDCTAFIVCKSSPEQSGVGTNRLLSLELDNLNTNHLWVGHGSEDGSDPNNLHIGVGNSAIVSSISAVADNQVKMLTVVRTGSADGTIEAYIDGQKAIDASWSAVAPTSITPAQFTLGGDGTNGSLYGDIGEVMVYGSKLSEPQRISVESWLQRKWNIGTVISATQFVSNDPDLVRYITSIELADGEPLEQGVALAYEQFILGCKIDGIWDSISASCILAGARTIAGATTPLKGPTPTNSMVDYDRKTGLYKAGTNAVLFNTGINNNSLPLTNRHISLYATSAFSVPSGNPKIAIGGGYPYGGQTVIGVQSDGNIWASNCSTALNIDTGIPATTLGFFGISRSTNTDVVFRGNNTTLPFSDTATTYAWNQSIVVNSQNVNSRGAGQRTAFYSIGTDIDLALLEARLTTLMAKLNTAIC